MHSSHVLREGASREVVRDILGYANIDVTQNGYGKSWWEERVDAVTQAVEAVTNGAQNAEKEPQVTEPRDYRRVIDIRKSPVFLLTTDIERY